MKVEYATTNDHVTATGSHAFSVAIDNLKMHAGVQGNARNCQLQFVPKCAIFFLLCSFLYICQCFKTNRKQFLLE